MVSPLQLPVASSAFAPSHCLTIFTSKLIFMNQSPALSVDTELNYGALGKFYTRAIKKELWGISVVAQQLRLSAHDAGGLTSIPGQGTRSHMLQLKIIDATCYSEVP